MTDEELDNEVFLDDSIPDENEDAQDESEDLEDTGETEDFSSTSSGE